MDGWTDDGQGEGGIKEPGEPRTLLWGDSGGANKEHGAGGDAFGDKSSSPDQEKLPERSHHVRSFSNIRLKGPTERFQPCST